MLREIPRIRAWVKETCLLFGCEELTAVSVSETFVRGLVDEWAKHPLREPTITEAALKWHASGYSITGDEIMELVKAISIYASIDTITTTGEQAGEAE